MVQTSPGDVISRWTDNVGLEQFFPARDIILGQLERTDVHRRPVLHFFSNGGAQAGAYVLKSMLQAKEQQQQAPSSPVDDAEHRTAPPNSSPPGSSLLFEAVIFDSCPSTGTYNEVAHATVLSLGLARLPSLLLLRQLSTAAVYGVLLFVLGLPNALDIGISSRSPLTVSTTMVVLTTE